MSLAGAGFDRFRIQPVPALRLFRINDVARGSPIMLASNKRG